MSTYTIVLLVALALLGALIAYLGDLLGLWLGKRRSTIFGLRPRQSARLMAAVVGAILPIIGLAVATVGSEYARAAVFHLNRLMRREEELTERIDELREGAQKAEQRADDALQRAEEAERRARSAERSAQQLRERRDELTHRVEELRERRDELTGELAQARDDLAEAEDRLAAREQELDATEAEVRALQAEVEDKRRKVDNRANELRRVDRELQRAQRLLEPLQQELQAAEEKLRQRQAELDRVEGRLVDVLRRQELMAEQTALFEPGDELIRVVLAGDETQDQMESDLYEVLHYAGAVAERRGVPEGENGRSVIAVAPVPPWTSARDVPERLIVQHVGQSLRDGGDAEYVVMVRAFRRHFRGDDEQLAVQFRAAPNRLLFHEGEVLDEFLISSSVSPLQAFETLWLRIADEKESRVRALAIAEGMLPHPESGDYGAVDLAELYSSADRIVSGTGMMRVRATAGEDTYTRGPLLIDIEVSQAEEDA